MIWAALLIGAAVLLAARTSRSRTNEAALGGPRHWLVLPDAPTPMAVPALPHAADPRSSLPAVAVAVVYPSWSSPDEGWRAEKPLRSWFRGPAPFAVAAAVGVAALDLTALGMGVPEIFPTHVSADRHEISHGHTGHGQAADLWSSDAIDLSALFEAPQAADPGFAPHHAAWDRSDFTAPSWERSHEVSHDWMA
jgi:hypothetical protein